jgi:hypothetical protein
VACTTNYQSILVQWVLSTQVEQVDKLQRHNLFQMFLIVKQIVVFMLSLMVGAAITW